MTASALPFPVDAHEAATFVGAQYSIQMVGGVTLWRLLGRSSRGSWNTVWGKRFWFDERVFFDCVCGANDVRSDPQRALASLRFLLRDRLAVAGDWNDFHSCVALRLPAGTTIAAAVGPATAQPFLVNGRSSGRQFGPLMLSGGAKQYIIDVEPRLGRHLFGPQPLAIGRA
jgi:hypothetical protein